MNRRERIQASAKRIIAVADYEGTLAVGKIFDRATRGNTLGSSGNWLDTASSLEECLKAALPLLFRAYDAERSGLLWDVHRLDRYVLAGIREFYHEGLRHGPSDKSMWGHDSEVFTQAMSEAQSRSLALAEEHFAHPGLQPWHQRHSLLVAGFTTVLGAVVGALAKAGADRFSPPLP